MIYSIEDIYEFILEYINKTKRTYIELMKIYDEMSVSVENMFRYVHSSDGYLKLHSAIELLCANNIIEPLNKSKSNGKYPSLKIKYRVKKTSKDNRDITLEMMKLNQRIDLSKYYLHKSDEFLKDKREIFIISEFLDNPSKIPLTVHERSWQLFGDEKYLKNPGKKSEGEILLHNLGLSIEDLNCYYAYEPFIFFSSPGFALKDKRNILLIENKDTFWSFHNILFDASSTLDIDMLIYSEGNKINSSFQYSEKLGITTEDFIWYFGDIDREGINIFSRLKVKYENYQIKLRCEMYEYLLDTLRVNIPFAKNKQNYNNGAVELFLQSMNERYQVQIHDIIDNNKYIPQEVMNYEVLCRLYKGSKR